MLGTEFFQQWMKISMSSSLNGLSIGVDDRAGLYVPTLFPINWISIYADPYWHTGGRPSLSTVGIVEGKITMPDPTHYRTHAYLYPEDDPSIVKQRWVVELMNDTCSSPSNIIMAQVYVAAFGTAK